MHGTCDGCGKKAQWLMPIHGDKGGPLRCFLCAGATLKIHNASEAGALTQEWLQEILARKPAKHPGAP
jgi:hypothetical protein